MSPGQVDPTLVRRHLFALDAALAVLRRHSGVTIEQLADSPERTWIVEHGLQLCAQNVLDVAAHIAAGAGRDSADYRQAIERLGELAVLPPELTARLVGLAGFRNVLVHGYLDVDLERVVGYLRERLDEFVEFSRHVEAHLLRC